MHRRPIYIYLFNVPSFSSRYFNKIKRTSRLGRLLALSLEILPDLYPSCAVTRAMAKKANQNYGMQDINLADTLIGQSFNDEISNCFFPQPV